MTFMHISTVNKTVQISFKFMYPNCSIFSNGCKSIYEPYNMMDSIVLKILNILHIKEMK